MNERQKAIALVGLVLCLLSGVFLFQGYRYYTAHTEDVISVTEDKFNTVIHSVQNLSFTPYSYRIKNLLLSSPSLITAFAVRERELLYQRALPKYNALKRENPLFQVMHFHLPEGQSFLRMHAPNFHGDDLTTIRPMVDIVHKEKTARTGFEIGRFGPFYRIVHPVFHQEQYIGAIEFGIKAHQLIDVIKTSIDAPVTSFFREDLLQKATHFQNNKWRSYGDFCLLTHDQDIFTELPDSLQLSGDDQRLIIGNRTFTLHLHPQFANFQNKPIGGIVVLQEITELLSQRHGFFWKSILFILALFVVAFLALYLGFGNIMSSLERSVAQLTDAKKKASHAKREWERTVDAIPDLVSILDANFNIIRTNRALPEMLGITMQEILGSPCYHTYCNKEEPPESCPYRSLLRDKKTYRNEIYYEKLQYYFDVIVSPIFDEEGHFIGAVHISRNITKRKLLEQEVEESQQYLTAILEASANTAIVATDTDLKVKYCNRETEDLLGFPPDTILGHSVAEIHGRLGDGPALRMHDAMKQVNRDGYYQFFMQHNERLLDAQISRINLHDSDSRTCMLLLARDVTQQKQMEKKLLQAEKLEAVGLLASGVAHDLNNILSGVTGYSELMLLDLPQDSELCDPLSRILKSGKLAAAVVADLLTIARGIAKAKKNISLNDLIQEYLDTPDFIKINTEHPNIDIHLELAPECWACSCSPTHITKILMNLISNAIEAIDGNGQVNITTRNQERRPQEAGDSVQGSKFVVLEITDTGPGITDQSLQHIFEPYYSTKKMGRSGSGLGLAVVWNVVKEHSGLVTVDSSSNGTVFTVYLPVCDEKITREKTDNEENSLDNLKGSGTILVVDDDQELRNIATQMLSFLGYTVHSVKSGEAAIRWLQEHGADLLVLDMDLGIGINGSETYEKALEVCSEQKAIVVSGLAEETVMKKTLQLGVSGFLSKPYSLEELGSAIRQAMKS